MQDEKRVISFEEHKEIHQMQESLWIESGDNNGGVGNNTGSPENALKYNEYQNKDLNQIAQAIEKVI